MYQSFEYITDPFSGRDEAIRNLGGMVWLYEKHLKKFIISYADSPIVLRKLLLEGKSQEARTMAHTIKGLSGTLGLIRLYQASSTLENSIINQSHNTETALSFYDTCVKEVLSSASNY